VFVWKGLSLVFFCPQTVVFVWKGLSLVFFSICITMVEIKSRIVYPISSNQNLCST